MDLKSNMYALSMLITRYRLSKMKCVIISFIMRVFSDTLEPYLREESHLIE